ncbi:gap junction protein beta 9b [Scleropages formosus]|nr:gap junction beta-4 protein-like [Scleropages formosus]
MNWSNLWSLISGVNQYSTVLGRVWFSLVFVFRLLVLVVAAQPVWSDESGQFTCNTGQPGCQNVCYDKLFPVSPVRLWALQLVAVICPSLLVVAHVKYREEKNAKLAKAKKGARMYYRQPGKKRRGLWCTYLLSLIMKSAFDLTFLYALYYIYNFNIPVIYKCSLDPCPNTVDCFISRPTEKKIFMIFMAASSAACILLCLCEISYLLCRCITKWRDILGMPREWNDPTATAKALQQNGTAKEVTDGTAKEVTQSREIQQ